jgi:zinc protease
MGYRFHPLQTDDVYTLRILEYVLLRGQTSRLHSRLVKKDRFALDLNGGLEHRLRMMALKIFVISNNAYMADRSRRGILAEIEKLKFNPISAGELEKVKNLFRMDYLKTLETTVGRALYLVNAVFSDIPVDRIPDELMKHLRVPATTIRSLAQRHFKESNRVILRIEVK